MYHAVLEELDLEPNEIRFSQAVALGEHNAINVHVIIEAGGAPTSPGHHILVDGSDDLENWTELSGVTSGNLVSVPSSTYFASGQITYRFIRLKCKGGDERALLSATVNTVTVYG